MRVRLWQATYFLGLCLAISYVLVTTILRGDIVSLPRLDDIALAVICTPITFAVIMLIVWQASRASPR
jgi:energy-converting hydrogenase Eha subunit G